MKKLILALGIFTLLFSHDALAATKYARAGGGNWSTDATWSTTSGGAADTTKCVSTDACILDASSGNVTVDVASAALSLNATGYTGTLTLNANLTVSGSFTLVSGMTFTPNTSKVIVDATSTITSGGKSFYQLDIGSVNNQTYTLGDNVTVTNKCFVGGGNVNVTVNSNNLICNGDFDTQHSSGNVTGTTVVKFQGSGTQVLTQTATTGSFSLSMTINSSGTVRFPASWYQGASTITYTAGTTDFTTNSTAFYLNGSMTFNTGSGMHFYKILNNANSLTHTLSADLYVDNDLDFSYVVANSTWNSNKIYAAGNVKRTNIGSPGGTATLEFTGSGSPTWSGDSDTSYGYALSTIINKSGGTLTVSGTLNYKTGTLTYTAGTVDTGTSTLKIVGAATLNTNGISWYAISMGANITLTSNLTLTNNWTKTAGTLSGAYAVVFNGTSTVSGATAFYSLTINSGKTVHLTSTQTFSTNASGTFTASGCTLDATTPSSSAILTVSGAQSVGTVTATDIDSSLGNTVHNVGGSNTRTTNWDTSAAVSATGNFLVFF